MRQRSVSDEDAIVRGSGIYASELAEHRRSTTEECWVRSHARWRCIKILKGTSEDDWEPNQ